MITSEKVAEACAHLRNTWRWNNKTNTMESPCPQCDAAANMLETLMAERAAAQKVPQ